MKKQTTKYHGLYSLSIIDVLYTEEKLYTELKQIVFICIFTLWMIF